MLVSSGRQCHPRARARATGKAMLGRVVDVLGVPTDERGALSDHERRRVEVKAPWDY